MQFYYFLILLLKNGTKFKKNYDTCALFMYANKKSDPLAVFLHSKFMSFLADNEHLWYLKLNHFTVTAIVVFSLKCIWS